MKNKRKWWWWWWVVQQLKQMGLCLPAKRQQRRGGPDMCWQTVPRPRCSLRKGVVAKSYPMSWRHQQCSRVGNAKMATGNELWCRPQAVCRICRCCAMHTSDMPEHTTETGFALVRITSEGPGAVGLCVLTPDDKRWAEQRHSAQTAASLQVASSTCKDRVAVVQLGPMHGPMLAVRAVNAQDRCTCHEYVTLLMILLLAECWDLFLQSRLTRHLMLVTGQFLHV